MMILHRNFLKYNRKFPDGKTRNQAYHISIDRRWQSSVVDVLSFRGADCDTDHYLLVAKVRERLAVSKQAAQKSDVEIFNLRKLNELEVRKLYQIKISIRFETLENASDSEDIKRAWKNFKEKSKPQLRDSSSARIEAA